MKTRLQSKYFIAFLFLIFSFYSTWGQEHPGFFVNGRYIYDSCGEEVVLRGVNKMITWTDREGKAFSEIAKTGANCVRIVMVSTDKASDLDKWVQQCIDNKMIPMPENHDATGSIKKVNDVVDWWTQPEMVGIIQKYEKYLLINIANEAGKYGEESEVKDVYANAITKMRNAGIHTPLVIDGSPFGQGAEVLFDNYHYWNDLDPDHNIIASIHMYEDWLDKNKISTKLQQFIDMDIPVIVGEFSRSWWANDCCIPYETILTECEAKEIGWLWWSWGPGNAGAGDPADADMDMTSPPAPGLFNTIKGTGKVVATNHPYSIKNTSLRPASLINDSCGSTSIFRLSSDTVKGGVILPAFGRYHSNDSVILKAISFLGYKFSHWGGDLSGINNPDTLIMDTNKHIFANFLSIPTYTLTTSIVGGGTISPESGIYNQGEKVNIEAIGSLGYKFSEWRGDLTGSDNPTSITMDTVKHVIANFTLIPTYSLTTNIVGDGIVVPDSGKYNKGDTVIVQAIALSGFKFNHWEGDLSDSNIQDTIIMNEDKIITAVFVKRDSLIAYWPMDETKGINLADSSGNGFDAVLNNSDDSTFVEGKINSALFLNGSREASITNTDAFKSESITIAAFVKVNPEIEEWRWVAAYGDNYGLVVNRYGNGGILFYFFNGTGWPGVSADDVDIRDGEWHHIAGSFNHSTQIIKIYRDGDLIKRENVSGIITYSMGDDFHIGSMQSQRFFGGTIDELRVYGQAISDSDIVKIATDTGISVSNDFYNVLPALVVYPNPLSNLVYFKYNLLKNSQVRLELFDTSGRLVKILVDENQTLGTHTIIWEGRDSGHKAVKSGIYFYLFHVNSHNFSGKIILSK